MNTATPPLNLAQLNTRVEEAAEEVPVVIQLAQISRAEPALVIEHLGTAA